MTVKEEKQIVTLPDECFILPMDTAIKAKYVELRRKYRLKMPDAIIAATAIVSDIPFITADKQFGTLKELKLIVYEV